jgi:hypothetical protein
VYKYILLVKKEVKVIVFPESFFRGEFDGRAESAADFPVFGFVIDMCVQRYTTFLK